VYEYRIYLAEDKEVFEIEDRKGNRATKVGLAAGQSLVDFLDLDMEGGKLNASIERISGELVRLWEAPEVPSKPKIIKYLCDLGQAHIYFQFVRLKWMERLDKFLKGSEADPRALLQPEVFAALPQQIARLQEQMRRLMSEALDCSLPGTLEDRLAKYFSGNGDGKFEFAQVHLAYRSNFGSMPKIFLPVLIAESLEDVLTFLLQNYIERGVTFKSCKHCGQFFVSEHGNADYCERLVDDSGKTCRDIGSLRAYRERQKQDPVVSAYNRAYKTHYARIKYKTMTREEFQAWGEEARAFKDDVLAGERTLEEFVEWAKE